VALLALDAAVEIAGPGGRHSVNIIDFFALPRQQAWSETILGLDELVVGLRVPLPADGSRGAYVKVAERAVWDFALVSAGVQLVVEGDEVRRARVALGGVAPVPWRARGVEEALVGGPLTAERIERAARRATEGARPLAHNAYKVDLARGVVRQALTSLV
jgi:xanthine dehydrogenase YagS FAD-binding subunit